MSYDGPEASLMLVEKDSSPRLSRSVAFLALQTCFRCTKASTYQLALGQSVMEAAREVYCLVDGKTGTVTDRP